MIILLLCGVVKLLMLHMHNDSSATVGMADLGVAKAEKFSVQHPTTWGGLVVVEFSKRPQCAGFHTKRSLVTTVWSSQVMSIHERIRSRIQCIV